MKKIPAEIFSRIAGYFRPVYTNGKTGSWNRGKTEEYSQRKTVKVPEVIINEVSEKNIHLQK